ncbi:MAG: ATP-binding protein, partial [Clostridiales bacterium]
LYKTTSISPVQNDLGKITHLLCTAEDVTDQKRAEEELIRAKDKAERSDRLKSEFLAQMSHEIRTPVNTILNYISLVKEELQSNISEDLKVSFKAIDNGSRRLIKTIDSLINMSQIQTGNYDYNPARINLEKDILENVILDYLYLVKGKNIDLKFINKAESPVISGDIYSITQIFANLIDNAVKYTNDGEIDVVLYNCEDSLCVDVSDTGIGISDEYMGRLFQPFSQEDTGYRRRFDGNGLGLALVLKYAELNNAEIKVKSEKGKGSTFTVKFKSE